MRNRVGGIYITEDKIVLIHRIKKESTIKEYYTIPGGGMEENEDKITTFLREMKEELGIDVTKYSGEPKYILNSKEGNQYYYIIEDFDGVIGTGDGPEFNDETYKGGQYIVEYVLVKDLIDGKINLLPEEIREQIINDLK